MCVVEDIIFSKDKFQFFLKKNLIFESFGRKVAATGERGMEGWENGGRGENG